MTCDLWRDKVDTYVDGAGSPEELANVEAHLRTCPACAADAISRLQMKRMTRAAAARYSPSPEFRARIRKEHSAEAPARLDIWVGAETGCGRRPLIATGSRSHALGPAYHARGSLR